MNDGLPLFPAESNAIARTLAQRGRGIKGASRPCMAGEIGEYGLGSGEGSLGEDDPLGAAQRREGGVEGAFLGKGPELAEKGEAAGRMQGSKAVEEEPAEEAREHAHRQEETGLAGYPARPVRRQAAAGNDDVDVGMVGHAEPRCAARR